MAEFPKPVIAAVNGAAVGLGCSVAVSCDVVYIAESAFMSDPHVSIGLVAGDGGAVTWPLLMSILKAKYYLLTGERIPAAECVELGLANFMVPDSDLLRSAVRLGYRLAKQPQQALEETKRARSTCTCRPRSSASRRRARGPERVVLHRRHPPYRRDLQVQVVVTGPKPAPKPRRTPRADFPLRGVPAPAPVMGRRGPERTSAVDFVDKAREVFLQKGYFGTTIDDIVEAAGISRSSFYTYFPTKRDVLLTIGTEAYVGMNEMIDKMMLVAEEGPPDAVERIVRMYIELLDDHGTFLAGVGAGRLR